MAQAVKRNWEVLESAFERYRGGDEAATRRLFTELSKILGGYFRMRTGTASDAEDLTQATLLKIHFARARFDNRQSLKTWVFTIASRSLIDHWRRYEPPRESDPAPAESLGASGVSAIEQEPAPGLAHDLRFELNEDLNQALTSLKPIDRSIVYLYGAEGLSMAEIADAVGLSEAAVKVRAHRSYKKLRQVLSLGAMAMLGILLLC